MDLGVCGIGEAARERRDGGSKRRSHSSSSALRIDGMQVEEMVMVMQQSRGLPATMAESLQKLHNHLCITFSLFQKSEEEEEEERMNSPSYGGDRIDSVKRAIELT